MRESENRTEVRIEQARAVLAGLPTTLAVSVGVMISEVLVLWPETHAGWIPIWLTVSLVLTFVRWIDQRRIQAAGVDAGNVDRVLRRLCLGAAVAGMVWAVAPIAGIGAVETRGAAFTVFIVGGTAGGALIQSLAYAPAGMCFYLPPLLASTAALFAAGSEGSAVIGIDLLLLTFMMIRQALRSDAAFRSSQETRFDAVRLARSLAEANREAVAANRRLERSATHDALTQLHNRAALNDELAARTVAAGPGGATLALAIVDLDNFKMINDTQGHAAGDRLLTEVADRLARLCRPTDFVARLGGDEFALLISGPDAHAVAPAVTGRVLAALDEPIALDGRRSAVGASIGLALWPHHGSNPTELLASADIALYEAKRKGRHRVALYDAGLKAGLEHRRRLESDIGEAIAAGRLELHFQPQIDLVTGAVVGHEGLIRWTHPTLGMVPPPAIVAAAQSAHVGDRLTAFVADRACRLLQHLERLGDYSSTVAINVSPVEFRSSSPAATVLAAIGRNRVDPGRVEVEITEEAIFDFDLAAADLERFAAAGVRLAIDDFGAGHFSLASIATLRLDRIKIDRSFVTGIDRNDRNRLVVGKILALARELGIVALAEGVETEAEAKTLRRLGCSQAQGWLYGRAEPVEAALARLADVDEDDDAPMPLRRRLP